jgi:alpha-mannosidase
VQIVAVKTLSDSVVRGEVRATPLDPQQNKVFIVRLQEYAGRAANAQIRVPARVKSAAVVNLTEDVTLQNLTQIAPLTVALKPFETKTVRFEIE